MKRSAFDHKAWAAKRLRERGISFSAVDQVVFEIDNDQCNHYPDYCHCDTSGWVSVTVRYQTVSNLTGFGSQVFTYCDVESLINEFLECVNV